ncbi:MAG: pyridoxamine 5'-phosphate oxidase family protein [Kiritimatiellia bacterium]
MSATADEAWFRPMRRFKQALGREDCWRVLAAAKRGVLSVKGDGGYPYGVPINFVADETTGTIYLHCAREGHKLDAIRRDARVGFTAWRETRQDEDGWSWHLESVVAFGRAELVADPARTLAAARRIGLRYFPDASEVEAVLARSLAHVQIIAIHVEHLSGKRVHER